MQHLRNNWKMLGLKAIVFHQEPFCRHCGGIAREIDHIKPVFLGGEDKLENLQPLCKSCHKIKTKKDKELFNILGSPFNVLKLETETLVGPNGSRITVLSSKYKLKRERIFNSKKGVWLFPDGTLWDCKKQYLIRKKIDEEIKLQMGRWEKKEIKDDMVIL